MNDPFQLVTNCTFKGKDYLVQMGVFNCKKLEITVTDKLMAEDWQCEYDASYIEALTHKTGNYKQFDVFVMMLKSGLLKTSDCITLDLLTFEDLEQLRCKKIINPHIAPRSSHTGCLNRRYLILTYTVEFDRIHYPLPMDYCGPPDPGILQNNIRKLEAEVERLKQRNNCSNLSKSDLVETKKLQGRVEQLSEENMVLTNEIRRLSKLLSKKNKSMRNNQILQSTLKKLEEQVLQERNHFNHMIWKLKDENKLLKAQIEELKTSEKCLKLKLKNASKSVTIKPSKKTLPDDASPEMLRKRPSRCDRSESQLTCRPISSWNSTSVPKQNECTTTVKSLRGSVRSRSSSESNVDKPTKLNGTEKKSPSQRLFRTRSTNTKLRKSSGERSRTSSGDRLRIIQSEISRPCRRKNRSSKGKRDSSNGSDGVLRIRSRNSSLSSRGSSKISTASRHSSHGSGDHLLTKRKKASRKGQEDLKFSMSDLEARIHALQKLLSEGLNF